jgi:hypothetical protein
MGLLVFVYSAGMDSELNVFYGKKTLCITNMDGGHSPSESAPAAKVIKRESGEWMIVSEDANWSQGAQMFGGNYAATSDSRWSEQLGVDTPVPIFDRRESWPQYVEYSR